MVNVNPESRPADRYTATASVAIEENDFVLLIDSATGKVERRLKMRGQNPEHAVFSPDGKWLRSSAAAVIDTETNTKIAEVPVGELPWGVAIR